MTAASKTDVNDYGVMSFDDLDARLHRKLDRAEESFAEAVRIASVIRDRLLWRARGFRNFQAYLLGVAEKRQASSISYKYRLANHLEVCLDIIDGADDENSPRGENLPPEKHSRTLGTLPEPEDRRQAYRGASRAAAAEGSPVQQRHIDAATDRLQATTTIKDPAERAKAQRQAMDDLLAEQEGKAQHRTQRPRVDKFAGHAEQMAKLLRAANADECVAMLQVAIHTLGEADLGKLEWPRGKAEKFKLRLGAVADLFE